MNVALGQKPTVAGIGNNSLADLAGRIVFEHEAIQNAPYVVPRAIRLGKLLIEAKNHDGQYGKWATWLKENCKGMSMRTAQRYMDLADKEKELEEIQRKKSTLKAPRRGGFDAQQAASIAVPRIPRRKSPTTST